MHRFHRVRGGWAPPRRGWQGDPKDGDVRRHYAALQAQEVPGGIGGLGARLPTSCVPGHTNIHNNTIICQTIDQTVHGTCLDLGIDNCSCCESWRATVGTEIKSNGSGNGKCNGNGIRFSDARSPTSSASASCNICSFSETCFPILSDHEQWIHTFRE